MLKKGLLDNVNLGKNVDKIRLFYLGKELKDKKFLNKISNYGIIQMCVLFQGELEPQETHESKKINEQTNIKFEEYCGSNTNIDLNLKENKNENNNLNIESNNLPKQDILNNPIKT